MNAIRAVERDRCPHARRNATGAGALAMLWLLLGSAHAAQVVINLPPGSSTDLRPAGAGQNVVGGIRVLPNGNILVRDPGFDFDGTPDVGAVHLYRPSGILVSTLRGSQANDWVGTGLLELSNGHLVIVSGYWNGTAGAATFFPAGTGVNGVVSAGNSLVGGTAGDFVGGGVGGVTTLALPNGNYVVVSSGWDNGSIVDAGAVTFGSGTTGVSGLVSAGNSLVGSAQSDTVGSNLTGPQVTVLANGNYVVASPFWDNGPLTQAGAVTFGSGTTGVSGPVSATNSLVGGSAADAVGNGGVTALANGNYVVRSIAWNNRLGAVTFGSGVTGITGPVSAGNSLVGSIPGDFVGAGPVVGAGGTGGVTALPNGNYVVTSTAWSNGALASVGAVTFGSGTTGISGPVSTGNSLVGGAANSRIGNRGVVALANANFVVVSTDWDNGPMANAGAVTFGSGTSGIVGELSPANSLVGGSSGDQIGSNPTAANVQTRTVLPLANGNYVVLSPAWDNGAAADAGAVTFGSGTSGISGVLSAANSLVGSTTDDRIGFDGAAISVTELASGNYVVASPNWDGGAVDAGAVTFGSGASGVLGVVTATNSLVGTSSGDRVGVVTRLPNGNYVVAAPGWNNAGTTDVGAVVLGSGATGATGVISPAGALIGRIAGDRVGGGGVTAASNSDYVVVSHEWDNGAAADAGAVTRASGTIGLSGQVTFGNSLVGITAGDAVGSGGVVALANGPVLVRSPAWRNGPSAEAGAVTVLSDIGVGRIVGPINSMVGSTAFDRIGSSGVFGFSNGSFAVGSADWDNPPVVDVGAVTLGRTDGSTDGPISGLTSVIGESPTSNPTFVGYDPLRNQLVASELGIQRLVLLRPGALTNIAITGDTPDPSAAGQPVLFTAVVSASPDAPLDGQVTFIASSGESCVDTSPLPLGPTTSEFSCVIAFGGNGTSNVRAQYTGSFNHAFSESGLEPHTTILDAVFGNGFEDPVQ